MIKKKLKFIFTKNSTAYNTSTEYVYIKHCIILLRVISRLLLLLVVCTKYTGIVPLDGRECFITTLMDSII